MHKRICSIKKGLTVISEINKHEPSHSYRYSDRSPHHAMFTQRINVKVKPRKELCECWQEEKRVTSKWLDSVQGEKMYFIKAFFYTTLDAVFCDKYWIQSYVESKKKAIQGYSNLNFRFSAL